MKLIHILLVLLSAAPLSASTFFADLEEAHFTVLESAVRQEPHNTNAWSIALAQDRLPPGAFYPLPESTWAKLRERLAAKRVNVSTYVPCQTLEVRDGRVVTRSGRRPATIYSITGVQWRGTNRLLISLQCTQGALSARGWTAILELKDGKWTIVQTTGGWVS
ncbi:MAG: hypothetical protein AB9869_05665 [Verrucomicrobiia bacterium]